MSDSSAEQHDVPLIPLEDFFRNPEKTGFKLSYDGQHLAFLQPVNQRLNLFSQPVDGDEALQLTDVTDRDIAGFLWASSKRLIYIRDNGGDENFSLFAVDQDGSNLKELTPFKDVKVQLIDDLEDNEDEILIGMNKRDKRFFDAYRINIHTGDVQLIGENPGNISSWITDNAGNLRVALTSDGVNNSLLYRSSEDDDFETLVTTNFRESISPLFFDFDDEQLFVSTNINRDKNAIVRYDPEANEEVKELYAHPEVDVTGLLRSKKREIITGVTYVTDKRHYEFFDDDREQLQQTLELRLGGYEVVIASQNKAEDRLLIRTYSDQSQGSYYFYDKQEDALRELSEMSPWLNEDDMAEMQPIEYKSRDGFMIYGYLTLPKGKVPKNLPVVVHPHGGPWARDTWGFNPAVQFLANRGYAVLQMNFRGSTGYGRRFWEAGFKEWGQKMQHDITDGVQYLIEEGIADPDRIGIYGGSYGGYAVLAGLAFTPEVYACGVDYVGVSNLLTFMDTIPPYWEQYRKMLYEMVGNPEDDQEHRMLEERSPVNYVDRIEAPLLIAQGANDPRVNKAESDQIVAALKNKGIDVPYIVKDNEGHGFRNEENRFEFYREMETFLAKHLGGRKDIG